jgi:hypothetical protein
MNKYHYVFLIPVLFLFSALLSCQSAKTPLQVSEHFWLGIQTKNVALVKKYSLVNSIDESKGIAQFENVTAVTFGKIIIDGDLAKVETNVTMSSNEKTFDILLQTYLENNNDLWKVNYRKTVLQLEVNRNMAEVFGDIEEMTAEMTEEIEESVEKIKEKIVPEIKSQIEHAEKELLEKLPELKNIFDEFLHELEKSLEELLPPPEEEAKTQET